MRLWLEDQLEDKTSQLWEAREAPDVIVTHNYYVQ